MTGDKKLKKNSKTDAGWGKRLKIRDSLSVCEKTVVFIHIREKQHRLKFIYYCSLYLFLCFLENCVV